MKKKIFVILAAALILTGCQKKHKNTIQATASAMPMESAATYLTKEEAEAEVGFRLTTPEFTEPVSKSYEVSGDKNLLTVTYTYENDETIVMKKYKGIERIGMIEEDFDKTETGTQNNHDVNLYEKDDLIYLAEWHTDIYSYSLYISQGMSESEFLTKTGVMQ